MNKRSTLASATVVLEGSQLASSIHSRHSKYLPGATVLDTIMEFSNKRFKTANKSKFQTSGLRREILGKSSARTSPTP